MSEKITNEESFYAIEDEGEETLEATEDFEFEFEADNLAELAASDILRIEDELNTSWGGVRSCSRQSRARSKIQSRLDDWAAAKIKEHNKLRYRRHGLIPPTKFSYRNRRDWDGERSCRGWSNFKCYIEFSKP